MSPSANGDNFTSFFLICMPFISFSYLIALLRTSSTMLNKGGKSEHTFLVTDLREKAFNLLLLCCWLWACHKWTSFCCGMFPLHLVCWEFLSWMVVEFCHMLFPASIEMIIWFSSFIFLCAVSHWLICRCWTILTSTWLWCRILLMYCWIQFANILLMIFAPMFIRDIGL